MVSGAKKKNRKIGQRINSLLVATIVLAMLVLSSIIAIFQIEEATTARQKALQSIGYVYANAVAESLVAKDSNTISKTLQSVKRLPDLVGVYVMTANHEVLAIAGDMVFLDNHLIRGESNLLQMLTYGLTPVSVEVIKGGEIVGSVVVIGNVSSIRYQVAITVVVTLMASGAALAISLFFASRLQRGITEPIRQLTYSISALSRARRYEPTAITYAEGETRELVDSFNHMISEINNRDAALNRLAFHDPLTSLPNAALFQRELSDLVSTDGFKSACVAVIEIDKLKAIVATLGQTTTEQLLQQVADRFRNSCPVGTVIARLSAEEIGLLRVSATTRADAENMLAPFVASLYPPFAVAGHKIHISSMIGFVCGNLQTQGGLELLRHARLALAEAKKGGIGKIIGYEDWIGRRDAEESEIESGLRNAIANHELEIHYQPIFNLQKRGVEGFEALMRWRQPNGTYIPPGKFVPIAERAGLITELGEWILRKASTDAKSWIDRGFTPRFVSVNVSPSQILLSGFDETVRRALYDSRLPANLLCLELTESVFIGSSMEHVATLLSEIKAMGVSLSLDDFGTGYSSLSYLEHLPFDKLKIDRSFVHVPDTSSSTGPLLAGIINLAHALGISVVAEGAEELAEVAQLEKLGCEAVQGYYYSKPLPLAQALVRAAELDRLGNAMMVDAVYGEPASG